VNFLRFSHSNIIEDSLPYLRPSFRNLITAS